MIHPTSVIDPSAEIHESAEVGPFSYIGPNVKIGAGTRIKERVSITCNTTLGENNIVYPASVLGGDPQDYSYDGQEVYCRIGDNNKFHEGVTINRGTLKDRGETVIGNSNMFMAYSHVGHDCEIHNNCTIANGVLLAGHVTMMDGVVMSGMTGAAQFVSIGRLAYIGGQTAVTQDVPPFVKFQGDGKVRSLNNLGMKRSGISMEAQKALREAYRLIWMNDMPMVDALEEAAQLESITPEVEELIVFLKLKSKSRWGRAREEGRNW